MKTWELKRGGEVVARISCHDIEKGASAFLVMVRNEKHELLASIYLGHNVHLVEVPAENKSSPA